MTIVTASCAPMFDSFLAVPGGSPFLLPSGLPSPAPAGIPDPHGPAGLSKIEAAGDPDDSEEEELGDEEDLAVAQPLADEESSFDDFDDEFDDDFEEEENDPDWDHPDDGDNDTLPPGKNTGRKK